MSTVRWLLDLHRRHPGRLLLAASAVFVPLMPVRLLLVDARAFGAAIALTVAGHLLLAAILSTPAASSPACGPSRAA